jgi:transposase
MAECTDIQLSSVACLREEIARLQTENSTLRADIGYWKKQHERAVERENRLRQELQDKNARIAYLTRELYERKNEQQKAGAEVAQAVPSDRRSRGQQKGSPPHKRRHYEELKSEEEIYDLSEAEKFCPICGLPLVEMPDTEDSVLIETQEVSGYRRVIHRKKYRRGCTCPGNKGITTAAGPAKLIPHSSYGASVWIHILIRKYALQIPVARILQNLSLHGVDIPAGSVGDNLKRLSPLFEPIYAALEARSQAAEWWQADETRWHVFEPTKTKTTYNWYLWVFISSESVVHVIDPTRAAKVIEEHLGSVVEGILLVDRYSAYKSYAAKHENVQLAFCWAHARRDFREAGLQYKELREWAESWEECINGLFHLNTLRVQYPVESSEFKKEDARLRQALAAMTKAFTDQLAQPHLHHRQKSVLSSLKNHWEGLIVFADNPQIPMDNNGSERTLRNPVVGRKNYYGSGTVWSAQLTAMLFSIFETLKLWDLNPVEWLSDYFRACALNGGNAPDDVAAHLPWNIKERTEKKWTFCGRAFTAEEIAGITALIDEDSSRNRTTIARLACEQFQWKKPDGTYKIQSMRQVLIRMEAEGMIDLPALRKVTVGPARPIAHTQRTEPRETITLPAGALPDLHLRIAGTPEEVSLWNEYIDRYHYIGYTPFAGAQMRYFVYSGDVVVALSGFSASAWRVAPRDWYIGWSEEKRKANLHLVVNNARFLILPWITSKNLASKILGLIVRRIGDDWHQRYNYRPVLLETFVEKNRFAGTCYKAANWKWVGTTKGRGKKDRLREFKIPQKEIFLYPLAKDFQSILC